MKKVLFDCDNTFGLEGCDVDDGLTLLYLLGCPDVELLGVTLTHGNGDLAQVAKATSQLKTILKLDFKTYLGSRQKENAAAEFLAAQVAQNPGEITIIVTGALTNLQAAQSYDPNFFKKVKKIIVMGGTIEPLMVNQTPVAELNFSSDAEAAKTVLLSEAPIVVMNGHLTAEAFFSEKEKNQLTTVAANLLSKEAFLWLDQTLTSWIAWNKRVFSFDGFCNWDMTTAIYLEYPELFSAEHYYLSENQPNLTRGQLELADSSPYQITMPVKLLDLAKFNQIMIAGIIQGIRNNLLRKG